MFRRLAAPLFLVLWAGLLLLPTCEPVRIVLYWTAKDCVATRKVVVATQEKSVFEVVADWRRENPASSLCQVEVDMREQQAVVTIWWK